MFGQLDGKTSERIADLLTGLIAQDPDRVLRALDALDIRGDQVDPKALRRDVSELVHTYSELTLDRINLGTPAPRADRVHPHPPPAHPAGPGPADPIAGDHRERGPAARPALRHCRQLEPFLRELTFRRFHPLRLLHQTTQTVEDLQRIATLLPDLLSQSLDSIKRGELNVRFDLQGFERLVRQLTRASNTLAIGIVISGLLVASSLMIRVGATSLAYSGFAVGMILSLWLVWNMSRS